MKKNPANGWPKPEGDQHSAANDRPSGDGSLVATSVKSKE